MGKLTGQTVASSYDQVLIVSNADGITGDLQAIESGDTGGAVSSLKISTSKCEVIPATNSTSVFEVSQNGGAPVFSVDTALLRVGISTDAPSYKLDVASGTADEVARFVSTDDTAQILIKDDVMTTYFGVSSDGVDADPTTDPVCFMGFNPGADPGEEEDARDKNLIIKESGNVGIGTLSPLWKLCIHHLIKTDCSGMAIEANTMGGMHIDLAHNTNGSGSVIKLSSNINQCMSAIAHIQMEGDKSDLVFYNQNGNVAERARIQYDGNVGFGDFSGTTNSVTERLEVAYSHASNAVLSIRNSTVGLPDNSIVGQIKFKGGVYDGGNPPLVGASIHVKASQRWTTGRSGSRLIFATTPKDATTITGRMYILDDGNVGIGTETPSTMLDVVGTITSSSATGTAAGGGIDAVSPTISVGNYNSEIVTTVFIDIGAGSIISSGSAGDVIGEDGVANAYVTRITTAINGLVYRGEVICLEVPTTGDPDVNICANSSGTIAEDAAGEGQHVLANCGTHTLGLKTDFTIPAGGIVDDYIYLTHGGTTAGTYNAGKFLIRFYGASVDSL